MCRSIKTLRRPEAPPTDEELHAAALQFVRKLTGYRVPSRANAAVFDRAVADVAATTRALFEQLQVRPGPREQEPPAG
jgi:hypothetical protein